MGLHLSIDYILYLAGRASLSADFMRFTNQVGGLMTLESSFLREQARWHHCVTRSHPRAISWRYSATSSNALSLKVFEPPAADLTQSSEETQGCECEDFDRGLVEYCV